MKIDSYKFRESCEVVNKLCHTTMNRIISCMNKHHNHCELLGEYLKACIVMEKLCNYCCTTCCNTENGISKYILKEVNEKCNKIIFCCKKINKVKMPKKDIKEIRCDKLMVVCNKLIKMCK
tara:strand:+ start:796 stop:1158 length:363 start_codon:yes stop_codon:yes gene_type:complete